MQANPETLCRPDAGGPDGRRGTGAMTIEPPIRGREKLTQLLRTTDGFVAVMMALVISALIGVAGLAAEVSMWYALKRQNQTAADASALTAAFEYAGQIETGVSTNPSAAAAITSSTISLLLRHQTRSRSTRLSVLSVTSIALSKSSSQIM
jgi:hypothetical protein